MDEINSQSIAQTQIVRELQNNSAAVIDAITDERDLINLLLGQIQMADAFGKFSVTVTSSKLAFVKENKLYKALAGKKSGNGYQFSGTWDDFCRALGMSREKADMDITNLRAFGEDALESMSKMGIGYREMRQFRQLPADSKLALVEVAKGGDKDSFIDLAEEIISRHTKEKEALTKQIEEVTADKQALDEVVKNKSNKVLELEKQLSRQKLDRPEPDVESAQLRQEANMLIFEAEAKIRYLLNPIEQVMAHAHEHDLAAGHWLRGQLLQLREAVEYLEENLSMVPWQRGDTDTDDGELWNGQDVQLEDIL